MWCRILIFFTLFLKGIFCNENASQGAMLMKHLNDTNYDINESPMSSHKEKTEVSVQLFINSFGSLNAANMDYSLDTFLRQNWTDPRLNRTHGEEEFITIMDEKIQEKIWKPDTFFENVKDASIHTVTMPNILLRLHKDGRILFTMRMQMKLSCDMNFEDYPFDAQTCYLKLSAYANTEEIIKYRWKDPPVDVAKSLEIAQFDMLETKAYETTYNYSTGNFSGLIVRFFLRRQNGYHILQTYVPTILIVSISWVSFWLDPNAVPGRVSLGVTTLLTLTTLASGIRQQLPPVSYVKAIDVWVGMCMIMVFGALLEFTLVNWLANKKVPPGQKKCCVPVICRCFSKAEDEDGVEKIDDTVEGPATYRSHARVFDRFSRVFFPGIFFVFNLYYWPMHLLGQNESHTFNEMMKKMNIAYLNSVWEELYY